MEFTCLEKPPGHDFTTVMEAIPELRTLPAGHVEERLAGRGSEMRLIAEVDGRPVGFKLGYALSPEVFYSWLGGVSPECRGHGVARALMEMQERLARERGFRRIRVKSMNRFPAMLRMLVSAGYAITDVERPDAAACAEDGVKIVFEKALV